MKYENIETASMIKNDIQTLEAEIEVIKRAIKIPRKIDWLIAKKLKGQPTRKTYKYLFSSKDVDSINSCILINEREAKAIIEVKEAEIKELKVLIEKLK